MIGPTSWLLLTLTIQVTVLAMAIYAIQKLMLAKRPKAAARLIAFGMVLLLVVSAAATLPVPSWLDLFQANTSQSTKRQINDLELAATSSLSSIDPVESTEEPIGDQAGATGTIALGEILENMAGEFRHEASVHDADAPRSMTWNGVVCFGVCFLSLGVFGFGRLLLGFLSLRKLRANSTAVSDESTLAMSRRLGKEIGCNRTIEILLSPLVGTAATIGLWKPQVFLANDFESWERSEQESVLAHEIAHIHHGDFAANIVSQICTSMHFFNPVVHWLVGQMRLNQEVAADQVASQVTSGADEYAKTLATLALRQDDQNQLRLASMFIPNQNSFVQRIKMLQRANRKGAAVVSWATCLVSVVAACAISGIRAPSTTTPDDGHNWGDAEATHVVQDQDGSQESVADKQKDDDETQSADSDTADSDAADSETADSSAPQKSVEENVLIAQQLIRKNRADGFDKSRHSKALDLLRAAIEAEPENIRAKVNLVDLYLARARSLENGTDECVENFKLAQEWLGSLTAAENFTHMEHVMAMPQLVDVCVKLGDDAGAKQAVNDAHSKVMGIAKKNPEIYEIWYSLVQCAVAVKDYGRANEFIQTAYRTAKTDKTRRKIMQLASLVYIQNADDFKDTSKEDNFRKRLYALCKAISTNPRDVKIYDRLTEYIDVEVDPEKRDVWLRNSILNCPIPSVVHILIGAREINRGDFVAGRVSWDIAGHQFATTEFVVHRLLSVAIRRVPEYGEGDLLSVAMEHFPDQYMLYETRGSIKKADAKLLLKQGRDGEARQKFDEAIDDFKTVLKKVPDLITANKHLKDCYEKIGETEKAAFYAKRVQEVLEEVDQNQRKLYEQVLEKL